MFGGGRKNIKGENKNDARDEIIKKKEEIGSDSPLKFKSVVETGENIEW